MHVFNENCPSGPAYAGMAKVVVVDRWSVQDGKEVGEVGQEVERGA